MKVPTREKKLLASDAAIVATITNSSDCILEIEKIKLQVIEKFIDNKRDDGKRSSYK